MPEPDSLPAPYPPNSPAERDALRGFARSAPLRYGSWGALKRLYKWAEADPAADPALLGALIARLDAATPAPPDPRQTALDLGPEVQNVRGVAIAGPFGYALSEGWRGANGLVVFDAAGPDPLRPARVGFLELPSPMQLAASGAWAFVLTAPRRGVGAQLCVCDLTDPARPRLRASLPADNATALTLGDFPLVHLVRAGRRDGFQGLEVVDVSDPDRPVRRGELSIPGASRICAQGGYAFIGAGPSSASWTGQTSQGGVRVVDVRDPGRPRLVGALDMGGVRALAVSGRSLYASLFPGRSGEPATLAVVDISDPTRPRRGASVVLGNNFYPTSLVITGGIVVIGDGSGVRTVDVSDPAHPRLLGGQSLPAGSMTAHDSRVYVSSGYSGLRALDITYPARPSVIGAATSADTLGYMKRRARRFLRALAASDPARYVALASAVLSATSEDIDARVRWVTLDILYGGSDRYVQRRHGRGPSVPGPAKFRLRAREERAPDAWDRHPEAAAALLVAPDAAWPVRETALKILRRTHTPLPEIPAVLAARFVAVPSPLLASVGVRRLAAVLAAGQSAAPAAVAAAYYAAGTQRRGEIASSLARLAAAPAWRDPFGAALLAAASAGVTSGLLSRRQVGAFALLAGGYAAALPPDAVRALAAPLLNTGRADLAGLVAAAAGASGLTAAGAAAWLQALVGVGDGEQRERVLAALAHAARGLAFDARTAGALVHAPEESVREGGWRLLAAGTTAEDVLRPLWALLLDSPAETAALRTAMGSAAALSLLARAGFGPEAVAERLRDRPFLVGLLTPQTFAALLPTAPASILLRLIAAASDAQWPGFREALLRALRDGVGLRALWAEAEAARAQDAHGTLEARLLRDAEVADTALALDDPALLDIREPAFGPLLERWARAHAALFGRDTALLLQAATHPLPEIRAWGLARVRALGMGLPFALRLAESGLPEAVDAGWAFFAACPVGDAQELPHALALCDSPQLNVRALGRRFVRERWPTLPRAALLQSLFQSGAPDVQAFVADLLEQEPERPAQTAEFDRDVLRARQKGRRAKEAVKARQAAAPTAEAVDVQTLLSLARGRTPRDADWALGQLAKLALAGRSIEGLSVDGVPGG